MGFPCDSVGKEYTCNMENLGSILGLGRSPGEGKGYPLQYSDLENSMDCIYSPWGYIKPLEENIGRTLFNINHNKIFLTHLLA